MVQALGGLTVAFVVKYADNIVKGFAAAISIIVSTLIEVQFFGVQLTGYFIMAVILVILSVSLYSSPSSSGKNSTFQSGKASSKPMV